MGPWQTVVGLEIHAQLKTVHKLFSRTVRPPPNAPPNSAVSFYDVASPGTLPRLNRESVRLAVKAGIALNGIVNRRCSRFVRKHYFYGDMPSGYQITQQDHPLISGGFISLSDGLKIRLDRIQLEQDSGKTICDIDDHYNHVDLNRAGVPLIEIVTLPDMRNGKQAAAVVKKLQSVLSHLGICDGIMANGSLRVDVNVSLMDASGDMSANDRVEIKNLNSIKSIEKAIDFEAKRQTAVLDQGLKITRETRNYNALTGITEVIRSKETSKDYRMFNDPDLPVLYLPDSFVEDVRESMGELPEQILERLKNDFSVPSNAAEIISSNPDLYSYFLSVINVRPPSSETGAIVAKWIVNELFGRLSKMDLTISSCPVSPICFRDLADLVNSGVITGFSAKTLLEILMNGDDRPVNVIIAEHHLSTISSAEVLEPACASVIRDFPSEVHDYVVKGRTRKLNFLTDMARKRLHNEANMVLINSILLRMLEEQVNNLKSNI
uniref:Glutamyl-tRNA(Gln) amidotransferase subunit B, mitochondrial n=1 Tax=Spongospora subterranea TaxID=70186 RepID=A0A0H5R5C4_9EUKA|eukprot:CRZ09365.1 hypothetical protein [Spongospora subterranea]